MVGFSPFPKSGKMPDCLIQPEQARQAGMVSADIPALKKLLHEDLIYIHSRGQQDNKSSFLELLSSGLVRYEAFNLDVVRAVPLSSKSWLLNGRLQVNARVQENPIEIDVIFTAVWLLDETWQMVSWHSTQWPIQA